MLFQWVCVLFFIIIFFYYYLKIECSKWNNNSHSAKKRNRVEIAKQNKTKKKINTFTQTHCAYNEKKIIYNDLMWSSLDATTSTQLREREERSVFKFKKKWSCLMRDIVTNRFQVLKKRSFCLLETDSQTVWNRCSSIRFWWFLFHHFIVIRFQSKIQIEICEMIKQNSCVETNER